MRFKSNTTGGYTVYAVTGTNTASFAIDYREADTKGLLGFAVERRDPTADEKYFMYGFKVFKDILPHPTKETKVSTFNHPVQSFVWDDFTCKTDRVYEYSFYPLKGKPKNIDRSASPVKIKIKTEALYSTEDEHDVFFNRGVASSQAYSREFNNVPPDKITDPDQRKRAFAWLGRDLPAALLKFIGQAKKGDTLLGCFYEFRFLEVAQAFKAALDRGVNVKIIFDAKVNGFTDKKGAVQKSFPREENLDMVKKAGLPASSIIKREANANNIHHNKFIVLQRKGETDPSAVWTGSTNISQGGIYGQTNVGHWVRNTETAKQYKKYWEVLSSDPGGQAGDTQSDKNKKNKVFKTNVVAIQDDLPGATLNDIPKGITTIFSPRSAINMLNNYAGMVDGATDLANVTLAFGVNAVFKNLLQNNNAQGAITFMLLEKEDKAKPKSKTPFTFLGAANNVYQAFGSYISDPLYDWVQVETSTRNLKLNSHVAYIHSKFLLMDPLSDDPVVVTGSANFSDASTKSNDENMIIVRGNRRVADIYFTEFNRLFNHYYFRAVFEKTKDQAAAKTEDSFYLQVDDSWTGKYKPGSLRAKRVLTYSKMKGFTKP